MNVPPVSPATLKAGLGNTPVEGGIASLTSSDVLDPSQLSLSALNARYDSVQSAASLPSSHQVESNAGPPPSMRNVTMRVSQRSSSCRFSSIALPSSRGSGPINHEDKLSFRDWCRWAVECKVTVFFTTMVTVWVLVAEDMKLCAFDKSADITFGIIGIISISVFTLEIILSCIGKSDYFLGFFFFLDIIATVSLIFDMPWVAEAMTPDEDKTGGTSSSLVNTERSSTARIGARSARVVRVIRLIRIAKLYKAVYEAKETGRNLRDRRLMREAEEMDEDVDLSSESRVGKKLSDLTIRRVIILVLSMLIILPLLSADEAYKLPSSASYGADEVWLSFQEMERSGRSNETRTRYEVAMLRYMYFHNWFAHAEGCPTGKASKQCPAMYDSHLYWVGMSGENSTHVAEMIGHAKLRQETVLEWAANASEQDDIYLYGTMPENVYNVIWSLWSDCSSGTISRWGFSLIEDQVPSVVCPKDLRQNERLSFYPRIIRPDAFDKLHFDFYFDARPFVRMEATLSICTTLFICVVLCTAAMMFYNDVNQLVLYPVEKMISKVEAIRDNPLIAVSMAEQDFAKELRGSLNDSQRETGVAGMLGFRKAARKPSFDFGRTNSMGLDGSGIPMRQHTAMLASKSAVFDEKDEPARNRFGWVTQVKSKLLCTGSVAKEEPMETVILEKTIIKLGSLLALGFGEAGAHIINQNMIGSSGASSGVNVMVPGQRIDCVIGHARIQNFSVATEVLQSMVMTFVNQVAEIVHGVVNELYGAANKNNGDTFLLIWRCITEYDLPYEEEEYYEDVIRPSKMADMAVLAFAKIIGAVHASPVLASYRGHPGLQQKLGSKYRVEVKCGLHYGWAIEGAVGSEYKIDASYLSPNVAVAVSLEEATQYYAVSFLASQAVVDLCSAGMRAKCRLIDRVLVAGSTVALELYSIDLDWSAVEIEKPSRRRLPPWSSKARMRARQHLEAEKVKKKSADITKLFDEDPSIAEMRRGYTEEFQQLFRMGYQNYVEGEWQVARRFLEETHLRPGHAEDGPSWALIRFMMTPFQFEAPENWQGIHVLDRQGLRGDSGKGIGGAGGQAP
eukprot:CAMPEP_0195159732 /NCGR_PEP_ID=MMETSP0448-20130528/186312_1 /TAXON_ID=66468 /ORGANISM="Heterocapsa triquestra, Strain CCMP 448" /LENGTH=1075 /DNA_ID=CAMNT_0040198531 /DNA_START=57 /DNA_END=3281 /DNA_ORIENTATION=+